jgi:glutathione S-transferase
MPDDGFTLHGIALSGPTYKVALLLSLAGQRFQYRHVNLRAGAHKSPEHLRLNRFGQVPALEHKGLALCQSGAILEYLAETLGTYGGEDAAARQRIREWLFWDADRFAPGVYRSRAYRRGFAQAEAAVIESYRQVAEAGFAVLDENLAGRDWLVGKSPTIADIACYGVAFFIEEAGFNAVQWSNVDAWMKRIAALPGAKAPADLLPMQDATIG